MSIKVAIIFERFGPYHVARLNAAARCTRICGIEVTSVDSTYKWDKVSDETMQFEHLTVLGDVGVSQGKRLSVSKAMAGILSIQSTRP